MDKKKWNLELCKKWLGKAAEQNHEKAPPCFLKSNRPRKKEKYKATYKAKPVRTLKKYMIDYKRADYAYI